MDAADAAQIAGALFTAAAAAAAWRAARTARTALEAQTQPLLADVPKRVDDKPNPLARITVGADEDDAFASVPLRNVGNGHAIVQTVVFVGDGVEVEAEPNNPVLASGERIRLLLLRTRVRALDAPTFAAAEKVVRAGRFSILVGYADASGRPRGALRLDVLNDFVEDRAWADTVDQLRPG